jgi:putative oxidoreductase
LRLLVASVFLKSGLTKISNFDTTIALFENEYGVPLLSPVCAAYFATFFELTCSVLLIAGLATRLAALPLIGMTLVIQFFVIQNPDHFYWLATLATILTFGGGKISLDHLLKKLCANCIKKAESSK